jgi:hypothetical protein
MTVKFTPVLEAEPTVTTTLPVVAPLGTAAVMLDALQAVTLAAVPLNFSVLVPCVVPKLVPAMVTDLPTEPDVGESEVMEGVVTLKKVPLLPPAEVVT